MPLGPGFDAPVMFETTGYLGSGFDAEILADPWPLIRGNQIAPQTLTEDRMANITSYQLASQSGISLTAAVTTPIYTVPTGVTALITGIILEVTAADTITSNPEVSIGVNPSTTNIFATEPLIALDTVGKVYYYWANLNNAVVAVAGSQIDLDVSIAATATALEVTARILGILV